MKNIICKRYYIQVETKMASSLQTLALQATWTQQINSDCLNPSTVALLECLGMSDDYPLVKFINARQKEGIDPMEEIPKILGTTCPKTCRNTRRRLVFIKNFFTDSYTVAATICIEHNTSYFTRMILDPSICLDRNVVPMCLCIPSHFYENGTSTNSVNFTINMTTENLCNESTYLTLEPLNFTNIKKRFILGFDVRDLIWATTQYNTEIVISPVLCDIWFSGDIDTWISNCLS